MATTFGITGGIGSGKSTLSMALEVMGFKVYNSDKRAAWLINNNKEVKEQISRYFTSEIYLEDGTLDRKKMAQRVFSSEDSLEKLNSIVHPAVFRDFQEWERANYKEKILFMESAILFESGFSGSVDKTITISAPTNLKIARVQKRDNATKEEVEARIKSQISDPEREQKANFTIICDDKSSLIQQILKIIKPFLEF